MRRPITAPLVALVALGGLVAPVQGGSISGTYSGDATLTPTYAGFLRPELHRRRSRHDLRFLHPAIECDRRLQQTAGHHPLGWEVLGDLLPRDPVRHLFREWHRQRPGNRHIYGGLRFHGWNRVVRRGHGGSKDHGNGHQHQLDDGVGHRVLFRIARPRTE